MSAVQFLKDELLQQGVEMESHETISSQATQDSKQESSTKDEMIKSIVGSKVKTVDGRKVVAPQLSKEDQLKFSHLYSQVSSLVNEAKFVVVSKLF